MGSMGGICSMQRRSGDDDDDDEHEQNNRNSNNNNNNSTSLQRHQGRSRSLRTRRPSRHAVNSELPDDTISKLYPTSDNFVVHTQDPTLRSPKKLSELCVDTICRSLPQLDGELPSGLPLDVVDDIVASLTNHSALNATTLKVLRNCELGSLVLAGCRCVTDEWLEPLSGPKDMYGITSDLNNSSSFQFSNNAIENMEMDDFEEDNDDEEDEEKKPCPKLIGKDGNDNDYNDDGNNSIVDHNMDDASCSTSSFVSAHSSTFYSIAGSASTPKSLLEPLVAGTAKCDNNGDVADGENPNEMFHSSFTIHPNHNLGAARHLTLLDLRGSQSLTDKGLSQLSNLCNLVVARLDNCHSIVGRGLQAFSNSHSLHTLSLSNCRRLSDEGIIHISHLVSLVVLSLDGCRCLSDRSLAAISRLVKIEKLNLSQCDLITNEGLDHLEGLQSIQELSLGWCRGINDYGLGTLCDHVGRNTNLRVLSLARCSITDNGVEDQLVKLSALEELDLNGCSSIGSSALGRALSSLPKLTVLDVSYCPGILRSSWQGNINNVKRLELCYSGVRDSHLSRLTSLPVLEELTLDSCPIGDWSIAHLADNNVVPNLTSLNLADTDLTDLGMQHFPKFEKLTRLSLFYCNITSGGLQHLAQLTTLEVLNLDSREIGDDGLWHLRNLTNLKSLDIFSGRITDSGCAHLAKIKSLESLELCGGSIGDLGCTLLSSLYNLTSLNLSQNECITNRGAAALSGLTNLMALNLSNTRVNAGALRSLSRLVKLKSLTLYGCQGIEDGSLGLNTFQNGMPNLKCLRLQISSADDGIVVGDDDDDDDEGIQGDDPVSLIEQELHLRSSRSLGAYEDVTINNNGDTDMNHHSHREEFLSLTR